MIIQACTLLFQVCVIHLELLMLVGVEHWCQCTDIFQSLRSDAGRKPLHMCFTCGHCLVEYKPSQLSDIPTSSQKDRQ